MNLTIDHLAKIFTTASNQALEDFFNVFFVHASDYGIETPFQINAFLAQVLAEVGTDLISVRENMNYRCSALRIFGYYRRHPAAALTDGRCNGHRANQERIGNRAYAYRIGNGGVGSEDGWRFRGGGFFQLTGRSNYEKIALLLPEPVSGEYLEKRITEVEYGLLSAMAFWSLNRISSRAKHIDHVTRIINRHTDSYSKRKRNYVRIAGITDV